MRLLATAAAALLLIALVGSWRPAPPREPDPTRAGPTVAAAPDEPAHVAEPVPPAPGREELATRAEPAGAIGPDGDAAAEPAATAVPEIGPVEVIELAEPADFAEGPAASDGDVSAGAGPTPAAPPDLDRSGDLVRRMLAVYEAMRE